MSKLKKCIVCGAAFKPKAAALTCSAPCRTQRERARNRAHQARWRAANPEKSREKAAVYYARNRQKKQEYNRSYNHRNRSALVAMRELGLLPPLTTEHHHDSH